MGMPNVIGSKPHQQLQVQLESINAILDGFESDSTGAILRSLAEILTNPELSFGEASSVLSTLSGRMPADLEEDIRASLTLAQSKAGADFPAAKILKQIDRYIENVRAQDRAGVRAQVETIQDLAFKNLGGPKGYSS